ncbi:MAG: hypothetical protein K0S24_2744 [Sphingobacterium sp.]|nr:hypothetical protein [Sphingobacterium sp.]
MLFITISPAMKSDIEIPLLSCSPEQNRTAIKCLGNIYSIR